MELHDLPDVELVHLDHGFSDRHDLPMTTAFVSTSSVVAPLPVSHRACWPFADRLSGDDEPGRKKIDFHSREKIGRRGAGNNELSGYPTCARRFCGRVPWPSTRISYGLNLDHRRIVAECRAAEIRRDRSNVRNVVDLDSEQHELPSSKGELMSTDLLI
jgi:hypothetical protein